MMKKMIHKAALLAISTLLTVIAVGEAGAYGGVKSASKVCKAPKLKYKQPEEKTAVHPGDTFSAQASHKIHKNSIKVSIKGIPVDITLTEQSGGAHLIEGQWPAGIEGKFARIKITAKDTKGCKLTDGWLLLNGEAEAAKLPNSTETPTIAETAE